MKTLIKTVGILLFAVVMTITVLITLPLLLLYLGVSVIGGIVSKIK